MRLLAFEDLLKACIGLDVASIGASAIERAVRQRQHACGLPDVQAYGRCVQSSAQELQALIEAVVVSETWFFRHHDAFPVLATLMRDAWQRSTPVGTLQLLSLPCSTGEEPYSMAMTLLNAGIPPERFRIDAIDISERVLAHAREGVYGRNSFRGREVALRGGYFEHLAHACRIDEAIRRRVHFRRDNLFAADFLSRGERYDAIFCRNLLIYFDRETQERAVAVLKHLLKPGGTLFVAPAESGVPAAHGFSAISSASTFAFRTARPAVSARQRAPAPPTTSASPPAAGQTPRRAPAPPPPPTPPPPRAPATAGVEQRRNLTDAMRLADQGHFAEAASCCEAYVRVHGPAAEAFYLLGLVRDATGNQADAERYYRKALYLEPNHHEALMQLALLIETRGDRAGARILRQRAQRAERTTRPYV